MGHAYEDITTRRDEILHQAVQCGHIQWIGPDELAEPDPITCVTCGPGRGERTWRRAVVML